MRIKIDKLLVKGAYGPQTIAIKPEDSVDVVTDFKLETEDNGGWAAPLPGIHLSQTVSLSFDKDERAAILHFSPQKGRGGLLAMVAELYTYRERYGRLRW